MGKSKEELKEYLERIKKDKIIFKKHFYDKKETDRKYLNEELVISSLRDIKNFIGFQDQSEEIEKYRIAVKLSGRYNLVIVCEIKDKNLYIITAWKTSRRWQKAMQK